MGRVDSTDGKRMNKICRLEELMGWPKYTQWKRIFCCLEEQNDSDSFAVYFKDVNQGGHWGSDVYWLQTISNRCFCKGRLRSSPKYFHVVYQERMADIKLKPLLIKSFFMSRDTSLILRGLTIKPLFRNPFLIGPDRRSHISLTMRRIKDFLEVLESS